jgi:2,4-dienoyl-CoA reductase-like NADH-dependent reductase (Old Yellow Enzyme family)
MNSIVLLKIIKMKIQTPFRLPCGAELSNRIAKAAMTERLATGNQFANSKHVKLYEHWSETGSGLLITGNVLVDKRYKEATGNIVIEDESGLPALQKLTKAGTKGGNHLWAQISHAGRQSSIFSTFSPIAPSAVKLKKLFLFKKPSAMTSLEIEDVIRRYVKTAQIAQKAGFTGVQIHAAHGYLLSQFLSPKTNIRTDEYGGTIQKRAKVLLEIIQKTRKVVGNNFPISVKLNSADFQRGGYDEADAFWVIQQLEELGIDLLEISGGTYEQVDFFLQRESTRKREAYFLDFANQVKTKSNIPLMVTGGFRSIEFSEEVLQNNELDVIGFGRPYLLDASFPQSFLDGKVIKDTPLNFKLKAAADMGEAGYYDYQIHQLANGKPLNLDYNPYIGVLRFTKNEMKGWFR